MNFCSAKFLVKQIFKVHSSCVKGRALYNRRRKNLPMGLGGVLLLKTYPALEVTFLYLMCRKLHCKFNWIPLSNILFWSWNVALQTDNSAVYEECQLVVGKIVLHHFHCGVRALVISLWNSQPLIAVICLLGRVCSCIVGFNKWSSQSTVFFSFSCQAEYRWSS